MDANEFWRVTREIIGRLLIFSSMYMIFLGIKYRKELSAGFRETTVVKTVVVKDYSEEVTTPPMRVDVKWYDPDYKTSVTDGQYQLSASDGSTYTMKFCKNPAPDLNHGAKYQITYKRTPDCLQLLRAVLIP